MNIPATKCSKSFKRRFLSLSFFLFNVFNGTLSRLFFFFHLSDKKKWNLDTEPKRKTKRCMTSVRKFQRNTMQKKKNISTLFFSRVIAEVHVHFSRAFSCFFIFLTEPLHIPAYNRYLWSLISEQLPICGVFACPFFFFFFFDTKKYEIARTTLLLWVTILWTLLLSNSFSYFCSACICAKIMHVRTKNSWQFTPFALTLHKKLVQGPFNFLLLSLICIPEISA